MKWPVFFSAALLALKDFAYHEDGKQVQQRGMPTGGGYFRAEMNAARDGHFDENRPRGNWPFLNLNGVLLGSAQPRSRLTLGKGIQAQVLIGILVEY